MKMRRKMERRGGRKRKIKIGKKKIEIKKKNKIMASAHSLNVFVLKNPKKWLIINVNSLYENWCW